MEGGGREPMILRSVRNDYGKELRKKYENGEVWESRHKMRNLEPRPDGISNTLSTVQKDNLLLCPARHEPDWDELEAQESRELDKVIDERERQIRERGVDYFGREIAYGIYPNASPEFQRPPLEGLSRCLKADGSHPAGVLRNQRIRRLTPRECFRLQGVSDYITDKLIAAGISDTQMYRAAGDACTVNVIYEIATAMDARKVMDTP